MKDSIEEIFKKRIKFSGEIKDISTRICRKYSIGDFKSNKLITTGYEDFNYILETSKGVFFVKVFADFRTDENCKEYIEVVKEAVKAGVSTPRIISAVGEEFVIINIDDSKLRLVLMEFIKGETFYELNKNITREEIKFLAKQAGIINSMNLKQRQLYDSWAIANFLKEFDEKSKYLSEEDLELVRPLVQKFKNLNIERLPHCFVHGDIISTNVIKAKNKLWIVDFSVSNYYPRIQELAILAGDLLFDKEDKKNSEENLKLALKEYQEIVPLTQKEIEALPIYIELAYGMYILSANYSKVVDNNQTPENEYWLNQGRIGLRQALED